MTSDNGPQFRSDVFERCLEDSGVEHHYLPLSSRSSGVEHRKTTPLWPQVNGEVETQNRSLLKRMRIAQAEGKDWKDEVRKYLVAYRSTPPIPLQG